MLIFEKDTSSWKYVTLPIIFLSSFDIPKLEIFLYDKELFILNIISLFEIQLSSPIDKIDWEKVRKLFIGIFDDPTFKDKYILFKIILFIIL